MKNLLEDSSYIEMSGLNENGHSLHKHIDVAICENCPSETDEGPVFQFGIWFYFLPFWLIWDNIATWDNIWSNLLSLVFKKYTLLFCFWGGRGSVSFAYMSRSHTVHHWGHPRQELKQGRTWRQELKQSPRGSAAYWLALLSFSQSAFLHSPEPPAQ